MVSSFVACANSTPVVEEFNAEYEMHETTSAGKPKNDTFIFKGKTTDGITTELEWDIIRNKGLEGEYSKKDIMGYMMIVSNVTVKTEALISSQSTTITVCKKS